MLNATLDECETRTRSALPKHVADPTLVSLDARLVDLSTELEHGSSFAVRPTRLRECH